MLEKISYLFDEDNKHNNERVGFPQVRLAAPKKRKTPARKPPRPKDNEKNLSYASCPPDIQAKLRQCRAKEWQGRSGKSSTQVLFSQRLNFKNFSMPE